MLEHPNPVFRVAASANSNTLRRSFHRADVGSILPHAVVPLRGFAPKEYHARLAARRGPGSYCPALATEKQCPIWGPLSPRHDVTHPCARGCFCDGAAGLCGREAHCWFMTSQHTFLLMSFVKLGRDELNSGRMFLVDFYFLAPNFFFPKILQTRRSFFN